MDLSLDWLIDWWEVNFDLIGLLDFYRTICVHGGGAKVTEQKGTIQYVQLDEGFRKIHDCCGRNRATVRGWILFRSFINRSLEKLHLYFTVKSRWIDTLWQGSRKFWLSAGRKSCRESLCGGKTFLSSRRLTQRLTHTVCVARGTIFRWPS